VPGRRTTIGCKAIRTREPAATLVAEHTAPVGGIANFGDHQARTRRRKPRRLCPNAGQTNPLHGRVGIYRPDKYSRRVRRANSRAKDASAADQSCGAPTVFGRRRTSPNLIGGSNYSPEG